MVSSGVQSAVGSEAGVVVLPGAGGDGPHRHLGGRLGDLHPPRGEVARGGGASHHPGPIPRPISVSGNCLGLLTKEEGGRGRSMNVETRVFQRDPLPRTRRWGCRVPRHTRKGEWPNQPPAGGGGVSPKQWRGLGDRFSAQHFASGKIVLPKTGQKTILDTFWAKFFDKLQHKAPDGKILPFGGPGHPSLSGKHL